jgi:hypothetical protein
MLLGETSAPTDVCGGFDDLSQLTRSNGSDRNERLEGDENNSVALVAPGMTPEDSTALPNERLQPLCRKSKSGSSTSGTVFAYPLELYVELAPRTRSE